MSAMPAGSAEALLRVDQVSAGYGLMPVLQGLSIEVRAAEIVALVGSNGAGKTTLLRALNGLIPRLGEVLLDGDDLPEKTHEIVKAGVALVAEGRQLFPQMTVTENLELGGWLASKAERARRLEQAFNDFPKLRERAQQLAGTMSGGEQQMVAVARAMMCAPRLLMLDEPSLGLAPIVIDQIYDVVSELAAAGQSILVVEENAARVADKAALIALLDNGELVWSGAGAELMARPEILETYLGA